MARKKVEVEIVKGYKATDKDMICNPNGNKKKYQLGKWYKEDNASLCSKGFHFCEDPLDILNYYNLCESRFFEVKAKDVSDEKQSEDSKRVSKQIKFSAELNLKDLIKTSFNLMWSKCELKNDEDETKIIDDKDYSQVATSGYYSQVATSGDYSQVAIDGKYSVGANIGIGGKAKGKIGNWITLAEWEYDNEISKYVPLCVKSAQIDGDKLKEDTWYMLVNGEFKKC